ncbi:hypothetical protein Lser_V15G18778 [Lactuca serriola]
MTSPLRGLSFQINEDPRNVSQESGKNNSTSTGVSNQGESSASISNVNGQDPKTSIASPQYPTTLENLPSDALLNIVIRLLSKQVAQMRCISKSWNALLSQSSFIKSHLHHSIANNDRILLVFHHNNLSPDPIPLSEHPSLFPHFKLPNFVKPPPSPVNPHSIYTPRFTKVIGSLHGLCQLSLRIIYHHTVVTKSFFRFGFDPKTDDYKVVKLIGLTGPRNLRPKILPYPVKKWLQVEVYSMRKGSWEFITQRFPSCVTEIFEPEGVCVDGHDGYLHWLGCIGEDGDRQTMVAFDLGLETFIEMSLPDAILEYRGPDSLGVLGGNLCFVTWVSDGVCEVWVMEESWVKCHVFSQFSDNACL